MSIEIQWLGHATVLVEDRARILTDPVLGRRVSRAGRMTNLALAVVLSIALGSGLAAFAVGTGPVRWVAIAHGAEIEVVQYLALLHACVEREAGRSRQHQANGPRAAIDLDVAHETERTEQPRQQPVPAARLTAEEPHHASALRDMLGR